MKKITPILLLSLLIYMSLNSCSGVNRSKQNDKPLQSEILSDSLYHEYQSQGRMIVQRSFQALSSKLMTAIQKGGVAHALKFCNIEAIPVTDSLSDFYKVEIKRVSLKNRNPLNKANEFDSVIIKKLEDMLAQGRTASDTLIVDQNNHIYYMAPIMTVPPCLQCHGVEKTEISDENMTLINSLYPDDKAIDYQLGDLRGLWKVQFNN
ncbi:MAG: hypothetical protein CVT92_07515 [Bacteroidetes bacterium HGW-Bacteroidetes-1]|jgi:hypothetical protein|nr:MAG: hypothetical protein CVT92_07515 [Bacteroidetes bacterium HGW-Bacteroidetes-1]